MSRHDLARADVDLALLSRELTESLKRPVAVSARMPGQMDEQGEPMPGVLVLVDERGEPLDAVDDSVIASVLRKHVPPGTPEEQRQEALTNAEAKIEKGDTAGALSDLLAMLRKTL